MTNCTTDQGQHALQRLEQAMREHDKHRTLCCGIHFSAGTVAFDGSRHRSIQDLLAEADALMYEHKRRIRVG
jgi:GGDEF domain-containing protein